LSYVDVAEMMAEPGIEVVGLHCRVTEIPVTSIALNGFLLNFATETA
jgi:hypothetical protein